MNIIIKQNKRPTLERIGSLAIPTSVNAIQHGRMTNLEALEGGTHWCSPTLSSFISTVNSTTDMDRLPDIINFDYSELEQSSIDIKDIPEIIRISYDIAAIRLNAKRKEFTLSGFVHKPIAADFVDRLKINNFRGGGMSIKYGGVENFKDFRHNWAKDNDLWDPKIIGAGKPRTIITSPPSIELTFRQQQVAHLVTKRGLTNKQIAKELGISEQAVKIHVSLILKKYGVQSRTQLVLSMTEKW